MDNPIRADLFVEDRAHEEFLLALLKRVARDHRRGIEIRVRSARGGHGRVLSELNLYQKAVLKGLGGLTIPDLLVIGIDANCQPYHKVRNRISIELNARFQHRAVIACPDPHIERWYLADVGAFGEVAGSVPRVEKRKCERDRYEAILSQAVVDGGHVPTLGGIEFAREIVEAMNLYRAARAEKSLKAFLDDLIDRIGGTRPQ